VVGEKGMEDKKPIRRLPDGFPYQFQDCSAMLRWARRIAFTFFMRFLTEGLVK